MRKLIITVLALATGAAAFAQEGQGKDKLELSGSLWSDMLVPTGKQSDGSNEDFRTNTFVDLQARYSVLEVGARVEYLDHPMPGFEKDFAGWGLANIYASITLDRLEATVGNFYDQFGSGLVLCTYKEDEYSLGVDNSLLGGRVVYRPVDGVQLKALGGVQRRYWDYNDALIKGADAEIGLHQWISPMRQAGTTLTLGGSWVNKREDPDADEIFADKTHKLNLPEYVNAYAVRANFQTSGGFKIGGEYAHKTQDPCFDNSYSYDDGSVAMLSASYSKPGRTITLQTKRSENFAFRSRRTMNGTSSFINHLPAFTEDHTYTLAAMYPYATYPDGEWAYQAQVGYEFRKKTALGGRYGTKMKVNFSHVRSLDGAPRDEMFYQDINVKLEDKRISKSFRLNLMYMNQFYNKTVVEGEGGIIHSDIFVADGIYDLSKRAKLRGEAQYLRTKDDRGDWVNGLLELSLPRKGLAFTMSDTYNCGGNHYWQLLCTYTKNAHNIKLGWGRTKAGYNCSGGVCRYVPETKGFTLNYNCTF